jgi:5'(3')-deoxyribonucleotidase
MRMLVDMDGVLDDFVKEVLARWNELNGTAFTHDQIDMWHMEEVLGEDRYGISASVYIDRWMCEPDFFEFLEPIPGAVAGFNRLMELGEVVVASTISTAAEHCYDGKRAWLRRYLPHWPIKNFIALHRKELLDADCLIDDGTHNIQAWLDAGKQNAILYDAPYNRNPRCPDGLYVRAYNWGDVVALAEIIRSEET